MANYKYTQEQWDEMVTTALRADKEARMKVLEEREKFARNAFEKMFEAMKIIGSVAAKIEDKY